jgi:endonuclease G
MPISIIKESDKLCRKAYLVNYDKKHKIPVYVAYDLMPKHAVGCIPRSDKFKADTDTISAKPSDYHKTGYDKGHMVPGADFQWDAQVELQSFYMSNRPSSCQI